MKSDEPRNLRGLVQTKDLADFIGASEATLRVWRKRQQDWVARGRPASSAVYTLFPDPVRDPQSPESAFLFNAAPVYDLGDVVRFRTRLEAHASNRGNPNWRHSTGA